MNDYDTCRGRREWHPANGNSRSAPAVFLRPTDRVTAEDTNATVNSLAEAFPAAATAATAANIAVLSVDRTRSRRAREEEEEVGRERAARRQTAAHHQRQRVRFLPMISSDFKAAPGLFLPCLTTTTTHPHLARRLLLLPPPMELSLLVVSRLQQFAEGPQSQLRGGRREEGSVLLLPCPP